MTEAQAVASTANATWALFWATFALCILTALVVVVGGIAARSAIEAYRLESDPFLVVTSGENDLNKVHSLYVINGNPALRDGLVLRPWQPSDEPQLASGNLVIRNAGPRWKSIVLEIQNGGRSPALDATITFRLERPTFEKPGQESAGFQPSNYADELGRRSGTQIGEGTIQIPALAPQSIARVRIENHLGVKIYLLPQRIGKRIDWARHRSREIAVITPARSFIIEGSA